MQNYHGRPVYFHSVYNPVNINADHGLLTKCEVKMAGCWPCSFSVCLWTKVELRKNLGQYPAILTEQAWSIKDLLIGFRRIFSCGTWQEVPSAQYSSILPAWVANHSAGFSSSCQLAELAI